MAGFGFCRLWRGRYGLLFSTALNIFLILLLLKNVLNRNEIKTTSLTRREVASRFDPERFQESKEQVKCFIMIVILSAPDAADRRRTIRETWLSLPISQHLEKEHRFVIGTVGLSNKQIEDLNNEHNQYQDLLLLQDHKDSYQSLTSKVLKTFIWVANNVKSSFVMKVDDDSFVRIGTLTRDLELKQRFGRIYWGFFRGDANVKRAGKWAEKNWILCDKYLPYANGGGYVLSQDLVMYLSKASSMLQIYNSEDVAVGKNPAIILHLKALKADMSGKAKRCTPSPLPINPTFRPHCSVKFLI